MRFFEGSAGTGKTTRLMEYLADHLLGHALAPDERVLALTFMHGARRRLQARLTALAVLRKRFVCTTIDSFAWMLMHRWRSLLRTLDPTVRSNLGTDYEGNCRAAALLLQRDVVRSWVAVRYPVVVVDELQDCRESRLEIVRSLATESLVVAAADEFQDLRGTDTNPAVAWLHANGTPCTLTTNHRARSVVLRGAAEQIRSGVDFPGAHGLPVLRSPNANVAAAHAARTLTYHALANVAVLTPAKPTNAPFVRDAVARLNAGPIRPSGFARPVGPFHVAWESEFMEELSELYSALGLVGQVGDPVAANELNLSAGHVLMPRVREWLAQQRRITGRTVFCLDRLKGALERMFQAERAYARAPSPRAIRAMTIHQAKNCEFAGVIILWPFQVGGSPEAKRRLLYNALTRARDWCVIIVQCLPRGQRLSESPFAVTS